MNGKANQRRYEIVFRSVGNGCGPACAPELYDYWYVEAYDFERSWPIGIAFVADGTKSSSAPEATPLLCFRLDYLFVIDEYRRQGVGTALLEAVKKRWPNMYLDAATEKGERFLQRVAPPRGWAYQQRPRHSADGPGGQPQAGQAAEPGEDRRDRGCDHGPGAGDG